MQKPALPSLLPLALRKTKYGPSSFPRIFHQVCISGGSGALVTILLASAESLAAAMVDLDSG